MTRSAFAAIAVCAITTAACADEGVRPLSVQATALPLSTGPEATKTLGKLSHRGTLRLTSNARDFGGLSSLIVSEDGSRFLAITDASHWLTGTFSYSGGKLTGVAGEEIAPLLDLDGKALSGKDGDAESLAGSLDGDVFVGFERDHRIWRYSFGKDGLRAKAAHVDAPAELAKAPVNGGLEGLTLLSDGRLLAMSESYADKAGNFRAWLIPTAGPLEIESLALKPRMPFELTDVRALPGGDVLTLERRFSPAGGVGFEMRRISGASVAKDAVLDGEVVADAGMNFIIDNMECLAVRRDAEGRTLVYVASDDNFNPPLQQTLIMLFELKD